MMRKVEILPNEWEKIQEEVQALDDAKEEISEIGRIANEQGSETFGHDNPLLENKKEQSEILSGKTGYTHANTELPDHQGRRYSSEKARGWIFRSGFYSNCKSKRSKKRITTYSHRLSTRKESRILRKILYGN